MNNKLRSSRMMLLALVVSAGAAAQAPEAVKDGIYWPGASTGQTEADTYTRYELLEPGSGKFKIYYEVTATKTDQRRVQQLLFKRRPKSDAEEQVAEREAAD